VSVSTSGLEVQLPVRTTIVSWLLSCFLVMSVILAVFVHQCVVRVVFAH